MRWLCSKNNCCSLNI